MVYQNAENQAFTARTDQESRDDELNRGQRRGARCPGTQYGYQPITAGRADWERGNSINVSAALNPGKIVEDLIGDIRNQIDESEKHLHGLKEKLQKLEQVFEQLNQDSDENP